MVDQDRIEAIHRFRDALLADNAMQANFRAAFPKLASGLLDGGELSDADLEAVAGGADVLSIDIADYDLGDNIGK